MIIWIRVNVLNRHKRHCERVCVCVCLCFCICAVCFVMAVLFMLSYRNNINTHHVKCNIRHSVGRSFLIQEIFSLCGKTLLSHSQQYFCSSSHIHCVYVVYTHVHAQYNTNRAAHTRVYFIVLMLVCMRVCEFRVCNESCLSLSLSQ